MEWRNFPVKGQTVDISGALWAITTLKLFHSAVVDSGRVPIKFYLQNNWCTGLALGYSPLPQGSRVSAL